MMDISPLWEACGRIVPVCVCVCAVKLLAPTTTTEKTFKNIWWLIIWSDFRKWVQYRTFFSYASRNDELLFFLIFYTLNRDIYFGSRHINRNGKYNTIYLVTEISFLRENYWKLRNCGLWDGTIINMLQIHFRMIHLKTGKCSLIFNGKSFIKVHAFNLCNAFSW